MSREQPLNSFCHGVNPLPFSTRYCISNERSQISNDYSVKLFCPYPPTYSLLVPPRYSYFTASAPGMAMDQHTPPVDNNLGPAALATCTPILALALLLYVVRIVSRMTPTIRLNYVDYIVSFAVVSISSSVSLGRRANPLDSCAKLLPIPSMLLCWQLVLGARAIMYRSKRSKGSPCTHFRLHSLAKWHQR